MQLNICSWLNVVKLVGVTLSESFLVIIIFYYYYHYKIPLPLHRLLPLKHVRSVISDKTGPRKLGQFLRLTIVCCRYHAMFFSYKKSQNGVKRTF